MLEDSERGNPLPPHGLLFSISSKIKHTTAFVTPVVEHWLVREITLSRPIGCSLPNNSLSGQVEGRRYICKKLNVYR